MQSPLQCQPHPLLEIEELVKVFPRRDALWAASFEGPEDDSGLRALDGVCLRLSPGESLALTGASGCGKTTLLRCILGIESPSCGSIRFKGADLRTFSRGRRGKLIQSVFQDSLAALNPRSTVAQIIEEPLLIQNLGDRSSRLKRLEELMDSIALHRSLLDRRPEQLSAGQRQRVAIARALAVVPELLLADEPTSALDPPVRAQVLQSLDGLRKKLGFAMIFVTHDHAVAHALCRRIVMMEEGRIVADEASRQH